MNPTTHPKLIPSLGEIAFNAYRAGFIKRVQADMASFSELAEGTREVWEEVGIAVEKQVRLHGDVLAEAMGFSGPAPVALPEPVKVAPDAHLWRDA